MNKFKTVCLLVIIFCIAILSMMIFFGCNPKIKLKNQHSLIQSENKKYPVTKIKETPPASLPATFFTENLI